MSMEGEIQKIIDKFHSRMEKDPETRNKVVHLDKTFNIDLGTEHYSMKLKEAHISDFKPELLPQADVTLITTPENLQGLIDGTLRPMKAFVMKKVQLKGKLDDLLFLKEFF